MRLAREIQMGMLRRANPWFPDADEFTISARIEPAKAVGGDFYDAFLLDADHLVLAIGDAAGKGVSAALFMVRALTLLRSAAVNWVSLAETVRGVNRALAADNEASMFLTLFMAVLDLRTGVLDYINFGHLPPLIRSPDGSVACHQMYARRHVRSDGAALRARLAAWSCRPDRHWCCTRTALPKPRTRAERQFGLHGLLEAAGAGEDAANRMTSSDGLPRRSPAMPARRNRLTTSRSLR